MSSTFGRCNNIDIILATPDLVQMTTLVEVLPQVSDTHKPVVMELGVREPLAKEDFIPTPNLAKFDPDIYKQELENLYNDYEFDSGSMISDRLQNIINNFISARVLPCPLTIFSNAPQRSPWWNQKCLLAKIKLRHFKYN